MYIEFITVGSKRLLMAIEDISHIVEQDERNLIIVTVNKERIPVYANYDEVFDFLTNPNQDINLN